MNDQLLDAENQLTRLTDVINLLEMAASDLRSEKTRAIMAGLTVAMEMVIDVQIRLTDIRTGSTARHAA